MTCTCAVTRHLRPSARREPRLLGPVVIDTGDLGALTTIGKPLASGYRPLVEGRLAIVSFVTATELRFGARLAGWRTSRLGRLDRDWPAP